MKYFVIFLSAVVFLGYAHADPDPDDDYRKFPLGDHYIYADNKHITDISLNWSESLPSGTVIFDKKINSDISIMIPKNIPRMMNLDFGTSMAVFYPDTLVEQIKESEPDCFYHLRIPVNDVSEISIDTISVAAGRWEPVTINKLECDRIYTHYSETYELKSTSMHFKLSPLKQIKNGVEPWEVKCNDGLERIFKHDSSTACVKEQSIPKLVERGWASDMSDIDIIRYSPVLFDGTGTNLQEDELIEYLKNKRDYLDAAIDKVDAKGLYPITGMSFSIGNNAYSLDEKYLGNPIALDIHILKEKFTKKTLEEVHQIVRQHVGNDIDIVFSKGSYAVPASMASSPENNSQYDTKYPDFPTIDSLLPEDRLEVRNQAGYTIIHMTLSSWAEYKEWENRRGPESSPIPPVTITESTMNPIVFDMLYEMWQFEDYEASEHNPNLYRKTIQKEYSVPNHHGIYDWLESEYRKQFSNSNSGFSNYFEFRDHVYRVSMLAID